ncbi:efflux RND transporter permease subunit [Novipirellula artificiosorum]|uniref:Toluene efflux pump membrane transporter TtgB n=1 Tax=Novipirellula artificiosorum TaxID=2528016 RepID=A0A5C6DZZ3_9BACT|nr:efflux RND transporter permease subunit [Novipirellula artificiosorum]TWU40636.1 Toluene efflux pump membrane transporter TtgB [Novipirellula artificiosorum]
MSLPAVAVKYKPIVFSLVVMLMVWGTTTFFSMPRREDPEFTIRVCVISTQWPGAPAEKVEELITDKIEQQVVSLEEVDTIRSTSRTGQSTVFVEVADEVPPAEIQNVWDKVRARVAMAKMPEESILPIVNDQFGDTAVLLLAIHQIPVQGRSTVRERDRYTPRQLEKFGETIEDALRLLPGVAKVDKFGVRNEAVYIETDLGNWAQQRLTTMELERLASQRNIIQPGGQISADSGYYSVKPDGEFDAIDEIKQIASVVRGSDVGDEGNNVYLADLGLTVTRDYEDPPSYLCRYGDHESSSPAIMVAVTMRSGANIIDVCNASKQRVLELIEYEKRLPPDIAATPVSDQSENVQGKISEVIINVLEAIGIVVVVVYLVVGFRTSFVMAANIPVVVVASVGLIATMGVQLEQISLAAIIISLGLLVDNAVQVCDQARTNQIAGMGPYTAAIEGANTLAIPMLVGTLTTMAAFVPMLFMLEGGGKEYVYSLPVTVSTTLALSWILAMTLCVILAGIFIRAPRGDAPASPPLRWMMAAKARLPKRWRRTSGLRPKSQPKSTDNWIQRLYGKSAMIAVRFKWTTLLATAGLCLGIMKMPVSSEFFPEASRDQFAVKIALPETATILQTDAIAMQVEEVLRKLSEVGDGQVYAGKPQRLRAMRTIVGGGGSRWNLAWSPEPPSRNYAEILVRTSDGRYSADYVDQVRIACLQGDPLRGIEPIVGARVTPMKLALGPPADPLVFRVLGSGFADPGVLREISGRLKRIVQAQAETWNVNDSWGVNGYQVHVDVDRDRATLAGVTNTQVAKTLNSYYAGLKLTTFREGDHQVPIYFRLRPEGRKSIRGLQEAFVEGDSGKVPLSTLADFRFSWEPEKIQRRDMNRVIEVSSRMLPGVTGNDVVKRVLKSREMKQLTDSLPSGFWIEAGGAYEESQESGGQMMMSFEVSFVLIVLCLIFQYNGWSKPLMILCTLPLALVGAWLGLSMTGHSLGFMPQLGILALFGIVLNTAIIFVEFADILIAERQAGPGIRLDKQTFRNCLIDAGKQRMLPIFLTTATTVGGLLPLALSGGPLWVGLAWCMIVGLLFTTLLTLYVLPALYAVLVETFGLKPIPHQLTE